MTRPLDEALLAESAERVQRVRARIEAACRHAGRDPSEVTLVGACKRQSVDRIAAAVCAGLEELGQNYVQEARSQRKAVEERLAEHFAADRRPPLPRWRMIGRLQRNKARLAVQLFDAVDTLERVELARELDKRAAAAGVQMDVCVQVNLSGEAQKGGLPEPDLPELIRACKEFANLKLRGLMTVPAASSDPEGSRAIFARLRQLRDTLCREAGGETLRELSMGMSADLEVAIEEGSTLVRVGTDLFGARPPLDPRE